MGMTGDNDRFARRGGRHAGEPTHRAVHARHGSDRPAGHGRPARSASSSASPTGARRAPGERPARLVSESTSISTIHAGQGAHVTTRHNAAQAAESARRNAERRYVERHPEAGVPHGGPRRSGLSVVLLVVAALMALAVVFVLGTCVTAALTPAPEASDSEPEQTLRLTESEQEVQRQLDEHDAGQEQADTDGSVSYAGQAYELRQTEDGSWVLAYADGDSLGTLAGTPVALLRTGSTLLVPENVSGGWDVACYVIGGHTSLTYVMSGDERAGGSSSVASVELDGDTLRVTDDSGTVTEVALQ